MTDPVSPSAGGYSVDRDLAEADKEREQLHMLQVSLRWFACGTAWIAVALALENVASANLWTDFWGLDYSLTGCAMRGEVHSSFCSVLSMPVFVLALSYCLLCTFLIRTQRFTGQAVAVTFGAIVVAGVVLLVTDDTYDRPLKVVTPFATCRGQRVEAECRGTWEMLPNGTAVKVRDLGCEDQTCKKHGNFEAWTRVHPFFDGEMRTLGGVPPGQCRDAMYKHGLSLKTVADDCDAECNRRPSFCRDVCEDILALCGSVAVNELEQIISETGALQRYRGEMEYKGPGTPGYSYCARDLIHHMSLGCVEVPECGAVVGPCDKNKLLGQSAAEVVLPFEAPNTDDRPSEAIMSGGRKVAFAIAGVLASIVGIMLEARVVGSSDSVGRGPRLWATRTLRDSSVRDYFSTGDVFLMAVGLLVSSGVMILSISAATRLEVANTQAAWKVVMAIILCVLSVGCLLGFSMVIRGWKELIARQLRDLVNITLEPSFMSRVEAFLQKMSSPSSGAYYLLNTMLGDLLEVISQSSAILGKSPEAHFPEIVTHTVVLLVSLILGTVCVLIAVVRRDSFFCIIKMLVDSTADVIYLIITFTSDGFGSDPSLAVGFAVPAFILGYRGFTLCFSVFEIAQAKLLLSFIDEHKGHGTFDESKWPAKSIENFWDTVERKAPLRGRTFKLPAAVLTFYIALIAVAVSILQPPGDYLDECAKVVGGKVFYAGIAPQVVTADGLLESPACDFSLVTEVNIIDQGIFEIAPELFSTLLSSGAVVTKMTLTGNMLGDIPDGLIDFADLQILDLSFNNITRMNLTKLPTNAKRDPSDENDFLDLRLEGNPIYDSTVDFSGRPFEGGRLPKGFGRWFSGAKRLDLSFCQLQDLGISELPAMVGVEEIDISSNVLPIDGKYEYEWPLLQNKYPLPPNLKSLTAYGLQPFERDPYTLFAERDDVYLPIDFLLSGSGLDWDRLGSHENHRFDVELNTYNFEFTNPMMSLWKNVNVTLVGPPGSYLVPNVGSFDFSHRRCRYFATSCRLDRVPDWLTELAEIGTPTYSWPRILRIIFDEAGLEDMWFPDMASIMATFLTKLPSLYRFLTTGNVLSNLKRLSGDSWQGLYDGLSSAMSKHTFRHYAAYRESTPLAERADFEPMLLGFIRTLLEVSAGVDKYLIAVDSPLLEKILFDHLAQFTFAEMSQWSHEPNFVLAAHLYLVNGQSACINEGETGNCPTFRVPPRMGRVIGNGYSMVFGGQSRLMGLMASSSHISFDDHVVDEVPTDPFAFTQLMEVSLHNVKVDDWFDLGMRVGGSPTIFEINCMRPNNVRLELLPWANNPYSLDFEDLAFPLLVYSYDAYRTPYNGFVNTRHLDATPWYVPAEFMDGFMSDVHYHPTGPYPSPLYWWISCHHGGTHVAFEGYTISTTASWITRNLRLSFRHAPVTSKESLKPLMGAFSDQHAMVKWLEFIDISGPLGEAFQILPTLPKINHGLPETQYEMYTPANLLTVRIENCGDDKETIVDAVVESLKDDKILSYTRTLELNEMDVTQAQGMQILDNLRSRTHYRAAVDLSLRSSSVTDAFLDEIVTLLQDRRLCLASLNLDVAFALRDSHAPQWSVATMGKLAAAFASEVYVNATEIPTLNSFQRSRRYFELEYTWCWMVGLTVPMSLEQDVLADAKSRLPEERHSIVEDMILHRNAPTMEEMVLRDYLIRQVQWDVGVHFTEAEYDDPWAAWGSGYFNHKIPGQFPMMVWQERPL